MRILYVITRSDVIGGASVHLLDLAAGVSALGHEVLILAGGDGVFFDWARRRGLAAQTLKNLVREISPLKDILAVRELGRAIKEFSPDVLHLHSSKAGVIGRVAGRLYDVPTIFTAHGWAFTDGVSPRKRWLYRAIERGLANFSSKIITVSNYDRELALAQNVGNPGLLVTIHNGVRDIAQFAAVRQVNEPFKFIMVARFDEPKNQLLVLRALAIIKERSWAMEFVGDGPAEAQCREVASLLGLAERVRFSGYCDDVGLRVAKSDALVLASKWEGLPLTIIEAMRGGLPVIASRVGGIPELVIESVTGFLPERESEIAMAACLNAALDNEARIKLMGKAARARYEQYFSFDMMRDRTEAIYQSVSRKAGA
ncbi:glycosyltransferase involved in cell wall biosynthesis [Variovorax boronicumulans]|uniref:glycosyltransferase family 4 protein n=1 Tax=Variovorax boronicumulans TaxID=436515 RepID=UPI00277FDD4F|nr:glycosyltransferase family 4 protein [Variovorax boronicumulans]MDP9916407.1 glycosyltransferase involved in cell wall biosynthesis [Variovorax boronicumulans]